MRRDNFILVFLSYCIVVISQIMLEADVLFLLLIIGIAYLALYYGGYWKKRASVLNIIGFGITLVYGLYEFGLGSKVIGFCMFAASLFSVIYSVILLNEKVRQMRLQLHRRDEVINKEMHGLLADEPKVVVYEKKKKRN